MAQGETETVQGIPVATPEDMRLTEKDGPQCIKCRRTVIHLYALDSADHAFKSKVYCRDCKRKILEQRQKNAQRLADIAHTAEQKQRQEAEQAERQRVTSKVATHDSDIEQLKTKDVEHDTKIAENTEKITASLEPKVSQHETKIKELELKTTL
jgi:flagellar biosynthesis GTPase FlhF